MKLHPRWGHRWSLIIAAIAGVLLLWRPVQAQSSASPASASNDPSSDEDRNANQDVVTLSPFEVSGEGDIGYYASNTLSGSRMNSKLEDLAASITVITPQQMIDTASTNINDVFRYEANTEGIYTYTDFSFDRYGGISEGVQMAPQTANRIRGIGSPDRSVDYFISIPEIPIDSYNIERLTINRGPNSILYGLGSASGLVDSTWAQAHIGPDPSTHLEFRLGRWNDYRGVFRHERTLIDDKLAVKVAALYQKKGYRQEPNDDKTRRYYGTLTFRPLENTTIRAYVEDYSTHYLRPNTQTPEDYVSFWKAAGSPTFNPSTMMVTRGDGTQVPLATVDGDSIDNASNAGLDLYGFNTRPSFLIENGQIYRRMQNQIGAPGTVLLEDGTTTNIPLQPEQILVSAGFPSPGGSPLFHVRGVNDKSLYDWDSINLLSTNSGRDEAVSYEVSIDQTLFDNLFINLAARREEFHRTALNAQSGRTNGVYIDVNETLLDGTPNPNFLKPFTEVWEPSVRDEFDRNQSARASAAYELDFTQNDNWLRFLGLHNLMAFAENRQEDTRWFRWREAVISENLWAAQPGDSKYSSTIGQDMHRVYYLGEDGVVTHAPGPALELRPGLSGHDYPEGVIGQQAEQTLRYFVPTLDANGDVMRDGDTSYPVEGGRLVGNWVDDPATYANVLHDAEAQQTRIDSSAFVAQSYWLDNRIVSTLGWRRDTRRYRVSEHADINNSGFRSGVAEALSNFTDPWDEVSGNTSSRGVVVKPFRNWSRIDDAAESGNYLADFLRGVSFYYNESDTFAPASQAQNLLLENLPLPTGEGKDYGVNFSLLENRLVVRLNWYEAFQANSRSGGQTTTITWRAHRMLDEGSWGYVDQIATEIEQREGLEEGSVRNAWGDVTNTAADPYMDEIAQRSGLSVDFLRNPLTYNDTSSVTAKGMEMSLDFNPTRDWTFKFTVGKQETIQSEVAHGTQQWLWGSGTPDNPSEGSQLYIWQHAQFTDPTTGQTAPWWTTHWSGQPSWGYTPEDWFTGVVLAPLRLLIAQEGTATPQQSKWSWSLIGNHTFNDGPLRGLRLGGSVRWQDKRAIGYYGLTNPASGIVDQYDPARPIWDKARYQADIWAAYTTRIFDDRTRMTVQLNVSNVFEEGGLQPVSANPDGTPSAFRILTPRQIYLTTTFDF